jgi:hypothetical protein
MNGVARCAVLVLAVVLVAALSAADDLPRAVVVSVDQAPIIDGSIGAGEWAGVPVLDAPFVQVEPAFGEPSPMPTTVRFAQFGDSLFVAVEAFDPDILRLAGAGTVRDGNLSNDDSIAVLLDTSGDDRTASFFRTNILGTQQDGRVADNGRTVDTRWDARWSCAAARQNDRWTVEFEIPLDILRFAPDRGDDWGVNIIRTIPRRLETSLWSGPSESEWRVSRFGGLKGLTLPRREARTWQLIPYALATSEFEGEGDFEAGADLRWRPSTQLGIDLTVNPDFALVEADVETINLSRFELRIPEKRPFFLEGNEMYSQRIRQFYSRRIGDISWGAKSTGTVGRTDISAIVTSGDLEDGEAGQADYGVVRLQHGLSRGSNIGLLAANRRVDGEDTGSVGVDTTLFFTETLGLTAQLLRVHGSESDGNLAWFIRPAYDSSTTHFHVRYTNLDAGILEDFNTVGFLRDDDRKEFDTNFTRTFWVTEGPVERVRAGANYNRYTGQDGVLRSWELDAEIDIVLRSGWEFEIERIDEYQLFEDEFRNDRTVATVGWDGRDGREIEVFAGAGVNFDSDLSLWGMEASWPIGRLRLGYSLTRLNLDPDPEDDSTWIHVVEGRYTFNPDLFIKLFVQTNSAIDKDNIQALFVWRFKPPFGSFQVAYQRGTSDFGEESTQDDTIFTKLAWVF